MHMVRVLTGQTPYGTDATHKDISLGRSDIHKLWAVYDSESTTTDPKLPEWSLTSVQGTFTRGELITGSTSGAIARIVHTASPITLIPINGLLFTANETITGSESGATATTDTNNEVGSREVTNNFVLDNGQRDNFYDIGRLIRKPSAIAPTGRLLIVCDYFDHGSGNFFTVDSYTSIDYKEIPNPKFATNIPLSVIPR